ncbi:MAG: hypothetical protein RR749_03125 [Comamonas sp.]|uniref:hypothetical protein n=1 Tax=Comamonas sp. BIGb0152 TaxID=2940601 RepID=UPI0021681DE2|nr:hypothetical protein [Comamonas sp. BIGb0152]MCS4293344.1 hypothetical protein [Comamonas sp. BIGb0152]
MTYASKPLPAQALSPEEIQARYDKDRISYPDGVPDSRITWIERPEYKGNELSYRGQKPKSIVTLASTVSVFKAP